MRYYYHEKERVVKLFNSSKKLKLPVTIYLRDRNTIILNPPQVQMIQSFVNSDNKKLKMLLSDKKTINNFLGHFTENLKKINNKRTRSKQ
jgi:hypothetical protein